ncbi:MAG: chromosomal replication initiator protein DnaA [Solirubrobacteraceae bacterium]|nr:chromosomal replication initiator protein DnaA [Solirubrobacteraceae bacterium]
MLQDHEADIWEALAADLRDAIGASLFDVWLSSLDLVSYDGRQLVLAAPSATRDWVADRFGGVIASAAARVLGQQVDVRITTDDDGSTQGGAHNERVSNEDGEHQPLPPHPTGGLNPKLTFEQFVIGSENRFAHAAALAVAENPGTAYNPLFLCGPPGVGKTHLLHSIGDYLERHGTGSTLVTTTAEAFANEFIAAVRQRRTAGFKARYRHTDVLLVDDVQFLMEKTRTEEEFFHTFNALRDDGAQIVLTSDRSPRELDGLHDRLRDRFASGLVVAIDEPGIDTRLAVLRKRAALDAVAISDESLLAIAERVPTNLRNLEAALIRLVAASSLTGRALDPRLVDDILGDAPGTAFAAADPQTTIDAIQNAACEAFAITRDELLSSSRTARISWPRQLAMYLAREHTDQSLPAIGERFGGRGHTTVLHACRRVAERIEHDAEARDLVRRLSTSLSTSQAAIPDDRRD